MSIIDSLLERKRRNALRKIAEQDYTNARGAAHLKMIKDARKSKSSKLKQIEKSISNLLSEKEKINNQTQEQLRQQLERHIVLTRLSEVPGIGEKYYSLIVSEVFHSRLTDLRYASRIPGIGENKQYQINIWIQKYEQLIPTLLSSDFPGKTEIIAKIKNQINEIGKRIDSLKSEQNNLQMLIKRADDFLNDFQQVSVNDFLEMRLNPGKNNPKIDQYAIGFFPEWEPMPAIFKQIIEGD